MKASDFLLTLDSHGIYVAGCLAECDGIDPFQVRTHTPEATANKIKSRGLGGRLEVKNTDRLVYGWEVAQDVCAQLLGCDPGAGFGGRGTIFDRCVEALQAAGQ